MRLTQKGEKVGVVIVIFILSFENGKKMVTVREKTRENTHTHNTTQDAGTEWKYDSYPLAEPLASPLPLLEHTTAALKRIPRLSRVFKA